MRGKTGQGSIDLGAQFHNVPTLVTAAHELKNPLALIRQLSLGLELDETLGGEQQRLIRQIILTSEKALRLTTDLSRGIRLEDSLFGLEPVNPQVICEEVVHELTPLYVAHGRQIRVRSRSRPLLAVANRDLLRRILLNFADNALHYTDPSIPVELCATGRMNTNHVRLSVRDHGPAVPAHIWQSLQAALGTRRQVLHARPQSSGLGLYIAGQFAASMNGTIGAIRHHDGASFYVDIDASTQLSLL